MAYQGEKSKRCERIERARGEVIRAQLKYSAGKGSLDAVNRANRQLAGEHYGMYENAAGLVPDTR